MCHSEDPVANCNRPGQKLLVRTGPLRLIRVTPALVAPLTRAGQVLSRAESHSLETRPSGKPKATEWVLRARISICPAFAWKSASCRGRVCTRSRNPFRPRSSRILMLSSFACDAATACNDTTPSRRALRLPAGNTSLGLQRNEAAQPMAPHDVPTQPSWMRYIVESIDRRRDSVSG